MANQKFFTRNIDREASKEGVWIEMIDVDGTKFGSYKCRLLGDGNLEYRAARRRRLARLSKAQQFALRAENADFELAHEIDVDIFIEAILVDWKDVLDDKGKAVAYSEKSAKALFMQEQWLFELLEEEAGRMANFRRQEREDTAKN
jgi:hypothetical protein